MSNKILLIPLRDWEKMDDENITEEIDMQHVENCFGIHNYNDCLYTNGFVGIGRLKNKYGYPITKEGKECVAVVESSYGINPWEMLIKVLLDLEYDDYIVGLNKKKKFLFKVLDNEPLIKLEQQSQNKGKILLALAYISGCYALCKKGLLKTMCRQEQNFNTIVHGKISMKKNIRENTIKGRNDRFYCSYIDFSVDNLENRIIKVALLNSEKIVKSNHMMSDTIRKKIVFCKMAMQEVKKTVITDRDFLNLSVSGIYSYYKPMHRQAKLILSQDYRYYNNTAICKISNSVYCIPYMINMESLFEFYCRTVIKNSLDCDFELDNYDERIYLEKGVDDTKKERKDIHLIPYCIPDIIIRNSSSKRVAIVLDVKYKDDEEKNRSDSLQLMTYALLTGAKKCGFIFPGKKTEIKKFNISNFLEINSLAIPGLEYYEIILAEDTELDIVNSIIK